uniref:uncharacterized protein LOC120334919 n=1 Tax=Styela clava TaxID=7725 RepID=UPI001939B435|nr:uncharacterized protein LOC120334919 [Styela clava]
MENTSYFNATEANTNATPLANNAMWKSEKHYRNWMTIVIVSGCGFVINVYVIIAMIIYLSKLKNLKKSLKENGSKRYRAVMEICLLITACLTLMNTPATEKILVDIYFPQICSISRRFRGTGGSYNFLFIYLNLWLRQRSIYNDPAMKHLTTKITRTLSFVVLFLLIISPLSTHIIYVSAYTFAVVDTGCSIVASTVNPQAMWIVIGSTSLLMQCLLLWLFVLPLYKHSANAPQVGSSSSSQAKIKAITKRAFITRLVCSITDTVSVIMAASAVLKDGITLPLAMYISLLVNLFMYVVSFPDWERLMLPCCISAFRNRNQSEREVSQGRSTKVTEA